MYMEQEIVLEFSKSHCHFEISIFILLFRFSPLLYLMLSCYTIFFFLAVSYQSSNLVLAHILCILSFNITQQILSCIQIIHSIISYQNFWSFSTQIAFSHHSSSAIYFCGNFGFCYYCVCPTPEIFYSNILHPGHNLYLPVSQSLIFS